MYIKYFIGKIFLCIFIEIKSTQNKLYKWKGNYKKLNFCYLNWLQQIIKCFIPVKHFQFGWVLTKKLSQSRRRVSQNFYLPRKSALVKSIITFDVKETLNWMSKIIRFICYNKYKLFSAFFKVHSFLDSVFFVANVHVQRTQ